jgi:hypothetical protein
MKSKYYKPTPGTVFIPFWSGEAEQMFLNECPDSAQYVFLHLGGAGLVYRDDPEHVGLPLTNEDFWCGVLGNEIAD